MHTRLFFLLALVFAACEVPLDPNNSEYIEIQGSNRWPSPGQMLWRGRTVLHGS